MYLVEFIGVIFGLLVYSVSSQDDGQYRPQTTTTTTRNPYYFSPFLTRRPEYRNIGIYRDRNDGRLNDGRYYSGNDGRYIPSDEGKYIHKDVPYKGRGGEYTGDGGRYKGDKDGLYRTSTTTRPTTTARSTTYRTTGSFVPYTYTTTTLAPRPTVKGSGTGEGGGGWKIIRWDKNEPLDGYHYLYETENGILGEESGGVENAGKDDEGLKATGFYEYTGDDGNLYRVEYSADENGFNPRGDHILPVPDSVKRTLEWLRAHSELERK